MLRTKVEQIMTRQVVSVHASTPFKDVAETLIKHGVSAVPVIDDDRRVIGVVSEADLLCKEEFREQYYQEGYRPPLRVRLRHRLSEKGGGYQRKAKGDTAAEIMTAPAVTVTAATTVVTAARLMDEQAVKRLIVVDEEGRLDGIVSRRDLIKVFVRSDADIAHEIREDVLERSLWVETLGVKVEVEQSVVTLTGWMDRKSDTAVAVRMAGRVDGVVDVVNKLNWKEDDSKRYGR
ncbi:CBS domain-containing protein [Nonomuraea sp. NPDC050022]|uniref:CBS domain-containing protein n=1 Tax=unclassified Nonomuraea TaxID=2593643 RepID=UPI0033CB4498